MENKKGPIVVDGFTNIDGKSYDIKQIKYNKEDLFHIGKFVAETKHEENMFAGDGLEEGVYIYQSNVNPNVAYRIYKEFATYKFNGYNDDEVISKLQEKQTKINLTEFPTAVLTCEGRIIGQEIPYYQNSPTLIEYINNYDHMIEPTKLYIEVLKSLKEMYTNGIAYLDGHPKNYMVVQDKNNKSDFKIRVIDFEKRYLLFDDKIKKTDLKQILDFFSFLVNMINTQSKLYTSLKEYKRVSSFEEAEEQVLEFEKKLIKVK